MRHAFTTSITLALAACGPLPLPEPDVETYGYDSGADSTGDGIDTEAGSGSGYEEREPERGTGGGSGGEGSSGEESSGEPTDDACVLPTEAGTCDSIADVAEAVGCADDAVCWAVVAAQYLGGDAEHAQEDASDCYVIDATGQTIPLPAVCSMATVDACLANAAAAGIPSSPTVEQTCGLLVEVY